MHVYHSHIDVHPQIHERQPDWWHWHQDGGRQNREIETDPRPMMSVKLAYWFSDVSETGRGNFTVLPGSHKTNWLPGPPSRGVPWPPPEGALQITANPGDLVVFVSGGHGYHVGIYAGGGYMYDAPRTGQTVGLHKIWSTNIVFRRVL